ncbi:Apolipoprotein N-acyltransferase [Sulfitobacter noctilucicola]|uniref:Apolipoprotein N-acyltransferase n=1 Tax=Sulfitobacter noctilucicola TaxID=1342301 RepID=A0A7W6M6Z3_9RHOB|nr:apolipoprotein N-acyltransferase [Sulfitobacter noctilucicola]KIN61898.1 Apolipoprotein N-acyltransferase [Sulfitobacter noctilucicola]MBB4173580.1 apolipoprotein N-acyltransferase [Sulfitobacter noctilucicola]
MTFERGWPALGAAALSGALAAFGQQPYNVSLAMVAGMAVVVWLTAGRLTPWQAALTGWAFGLGYFMHALQWIVSPFMVDVARHGWMAPFALVFLAGGLAFFWGGAFWLARRLSRQPVLWGLILTWPAAEMLRAYIFTGFPWAMPSQILVDRLLGQGLAWVGPHGMNVVLVAASVALASCAVPRLRTKVTYLRDAMLGIVLVVAVLPVSRSEAPMTDHIVRLIQPNAAQRDKWDPDKIPVFFDRQLQLSAAPPIEGNAPPDLVLWSETAIPWVLDLAGSSLSEIANAAGAANVALGVQRRDMVNYYNSMIVLGTQGEVTQTYDKHHLVPFGEYMPFAGLMARFEIFGLAQRARGGYASGPGPTLLDFGKLGRALPLICYEAVFAQDVNSTPQRPDFLIQITNDAWFGKAAGPRQHLAQARMRAIEQGLPLARSANTGVSAMIDPYGRITASIPLNTPGFVDATLAQPLPPTIYSRTKDWPALFVLLGGLLIVTIGGWQRAKRLNH